MQTRSQQQLASIDWRYDSSRSFG